MKYRICVLIIMFIIILPSTIYGLSGEEFNGGVYDSEWYTTEWDQRGELSNTLGDQDLTTGLLIDGDEGNISEININTTGHPWGKIKIFATGVKDSLYIDLYDDYNMTNSTGWCEINTSFNGTQQDILSNDLMCGSTNDYLNTGFVQIYPSDGQAMIYEVEIYTTNQLLPEIVPTEIIPKEKAEGSSNVLSSIFLTVTKALGSVERATEEIDKIILDDSLALNYLGYTKYIFGDYLYYLFTIVLIVSIGFYFFKFVIKMIQYVKTILPW